MRPVLRPRSTPRAFAIAAFFALSPGILLAQTKVTGRVLSDQGVPLPGANVRILALNISIGTNEQGVYTIDIPAARVTGQSVQIQARSFGFLPVSRQITLTQG